MPAPLTLTTAPLEHPAMDYAFLRQEGIRHLERLAGSLWTDFNAHDPGITILEQLCYALTDLAYRIDYGLPDLLSEDGGNPGDSLFTAARILTSFPVTITDLRKLVIDVPGVKNAWVEKVEEQQMPIYFDPGGQEISLTAKPDSVPIAIKGLLRVLIEKSDLVDIDGTVVKAEVTRRLHAHRNLCEDFEDIRILDPQYVAVRARIEIEQVDDAEDILVKIYQCIADYISPSIRFYSLDQLLRNGKPVDEIFDGPWLDHGFIDTDELLQTKRRTALRTSDLIQEIMHVPGVRAISEIGLVAGGNREPWSLDLDPNRTPKLDLAGSDISLERNQLKAAILIDRVQERYVERLKAATMFPTLAPEERDLPLPQGRDRHAGRYHSIQHQFPAVYGIGELGLPESASPERKAQARQLKAYLMFFDQLFANYFAQLAHVKDLFSFRTGTTETYFSQPVDDPNLGVKDILVNDRTTYQLKLQQITGNPYEPPNANESRPADPRRKHRFLTHLIARFAEQFTDYSLLSFGAGEVENENTAAEKLVQDKESFLQDYPRISSARGTGFNYLSADANQSGLANRVRRKLGVTASQDEDFYIVEHVLLRPMEGDKQQQAPLLGAARAKDPYSLQLSFIFPNWPPRFQNTEFKQFVEKTVNEETPAHLTVYTQWLDKDTMTAFAAAYNDWTDKRRRYWNEKVGA